MNISESSSIQSSSASLSSSSESSQPNLNIIKVDDKKIEENSSPLDSRSEMDPKTKESISNISLTSLPTPAPLLSGSELLTLAEMGKRKKKKKLSPLENKLKILPKNRAEMAELQEKYQQELKSKFRLLGMDRSRMSSDLGLARWSCERETSILISSKRIPSWMGSRIDGEIFLSPEETLYALENEMIMVEYQDLPLNFQAAYRLLLKDENSMKNYRIFSYFARLGYRVRPCREKPTNNIKQQQFQDTDKLSTNSSSLHTVDQSSEKPMTSSISSTNPSSSFDLKIKPLRREMFLSGTCFNKPSNWKEWERDRLNITDSNSALVVDIEHLQQIDDNALMACKLPDAPLRSGDLVPLLNQIKVKSIAQVQDILKRNGPKDRSSPSSNYTNGIDLVYEIFLPEVKGISRASPDFFISVCESDNFFPFGANLSPISPHEPTILFAVFNQLDFNIYTSRSFECWDEMPRFWDSSLKNT
ncbi:tRNA splicing endonuclease subunit 54 [Brevipalpus obovatus]|uniref:tRNA splicing endonuclease subunit 54 n=1 Tax=Brevipalpus obovatus TaxID=246614 RepID=UPI003D9DF4BB